MFRRMPCNVLSSLFEFSSTEEVRCEAKKRKIVWIPTVQEILLTCQWFHKKPRDKWTAGDMENIKNYNNLKHLNKFSGFPKRRKNLGKFVAADCVISCATHTHRLFSLSRYRQAILSERRADRRIRRLFGQQQSSDWISGSIVAPLARLRQRWTLLAQGFRGRTAPRHRWRWVQYNPKLRLWK